MKRIVLLWLSAAVLTLMLAALANAQTDALGDYARQQRKEKAQKPEAKRFDNDNLPTSDKLSVVGNAPDNKEEPAAGEEGAEATQADKAEGDQANAAAKETKAEGKPGESPEARQKFFEDWKSKIGTQRDQIDLLSRELDVIQREYRLRAASFYADAGNRLRNSGNWDQEDANYKKQIAEKQKALDAAKQKLDDLQEQARKSGVPSSMRE